MDRIELLKVYAKETLKKRAPPMDTDLAMALDVNEMDVFDMLNGVNYVAYGDEEYGNYILILPPAVEHNTPSELLRLYWLYYRQDILNVLYAYLRHEFIDKNMLLKKNLIDGRGAVWGSPIVVYTMAILRYNGVPYAIKEKGSRLYVSYDGIRFVGHKTKSIPEDMLQGFETIPFNYIYVFERDRA